RRDHAGWWKIVASGEAAARSCQRVSEGVTIRRSAISCMGLTFANAFVRTLMLAQTVNHATDGGYFGEAPAGDDAIRRAEHRVVDVVVRDRVEHDLPTKADLEKVRRFMSRSRKMAPVEQRACGVGIDTFHVEAAIAMLFGPFDRVPPDAVIGPPVAVLARPAEHLAERHRPERDQDHCRDRFASILGDLHCDVAPWLEQTPHGGEVLFRIGNE